MKLYIFLYIENTSNEVISAPHIIVVGTAGLFLIIDACAFQLSNDYLAYATTPSLLPSAYNVEIDKF